MRKIFKMGAAFKRIMALALAFVLVLGYIPAEVSAANGDYTVAGTFNGWNTTANPMTDNRNGTWTTTLPLAAGYYEFKVTNGSWDKSWGGTGPDGNYALTVVRDCDVTFKFLLSGEKASVLVDDKVTVYFVNTANWTNVYAYSWSDSAYHLGAWSGTKMTKVTDNIWSIQIPAADCSNIIFHNASGTQTGNLSVPYDGRLVYTYSTGTWTSCASSHNWNNGTCTICGASCSHSSHGTDGNCSSCGLNVGHSYDSTGLCGCGLQAEALVDDIHFASFDSAINMVSSGGTIKLLTNVTAEDVNGSNGHYLDLNGKTLTVSELWAPSTSFLRIQDSSSGETGKIVGDVYTSQYLYLEGGTIEGTVRLTSYSQLKGSFIMTGGAIKADTDIYINTDGASVKLQGGEFTDGLKIGNNTSVATPMTLADTISPDYRFYQNGSVVDMTGITDTISGSTVTVQTHTHTYSSATGFCPCGDECAHSSKTNGVCDTCGMADAHTHEYVDGACSCGKTANVSVTYNGVTKYYDTVSDALATLNGSNAGAVVTLLNDVTGDNLGVDQYAQYTLELNGYTMTADTLHSPSANGITIQDSSAAKTGTVDAEVWIVGPSYIKSGTFKQSVQVTTSANVMGKLTVEGGTFTAATDFLVADDNCTLTLQGGSFPGGILLGRNGDATSIDLTDLVSGDYKYMQSGIAAPLTDGLMEITGDVVVLSHAAHSFDASGYCAGCGAQAIASVTRDGTTNYHITEYYLERELHAGMTDCTIRLLKDFSCETFDIACGCVLDLNGHTLTASQGVDLPLSSGATIMDTSAEKDGKIVGTVYAAYSTALQSGTIAGTVSFPKKASSTGYTFRVEGGTIDSAMDFGINDNHTSITITGGTFPGGISIACGGDVTNPITLADCIPSGYAYFLDGNVVTLTEGQTEITGGDVTVAAYVAHTHTYTNGFCANIKSDSTPCGAYEAPEGEGTEASPYLIDNAGKLFWFAAVVNGGYEDTQGNSAAWAKVTEEITIPEGMTWTPISGYTGTFDGGSKTISGMHVASDAYYVGMFSKTGTCTIQNISITDSSFETTKAGGYAGAIAGYCGDGTSDKATITGCHVGDVTVTGWTAGGITGCLYNYSEVKNCTTSDGLVVNAVQEGGAVAGRCQSGSYIEWVSAQGTVTGYYAGGIVGYVFNDAGPYVNRSNEVVMSTYVGDVGTSSTRYAGGIIGYVSDSSKATINNCSVKCNVTAEYSVNSRACGLLGHSNNGTNSMVSVSNSFTIDTTLNPANINKASLASGGATVTNCYSDDQENLLTLPSVNEVNCAKKTDEQFASGEVAYLLDAPQSTHAWGQNIDNGNQNYGFPVRGQHKVYQVVADCLGSVGYSNTESTGTPSHNYVNGFCTNENAEGGLCDAYEPAVPVTSENYAELSLTEDYIGYYAITNAGQLYWFAQQVDTMPEVYSDKWAVLTQDITVNQQVLTEESKLISDPSGLRTWNPIGSYDVAYNGTFDGNGKTISGLYLNDDSQEYVGLIAVVGEGATVKDVTLSNSYLYAKLRVGGIAAINSGTIEGCTNNSRVQAKENNVGGIASNNNGTVKQCGNTGPVAGNMQTAGGIVSDNRSVVTECWNEGKVYSGSWGVSGGIVGYNVGEVTKCWNDGYIVTDGASSGGIVGCCPGTVRNCWNTGDISCSAGWDGGIVGLLQRGTVENCWSMGAVEILASGAGDGGDIVGGIDGASIIKNCYSTKQVIGQYVTEWSADTTPIDVEVKPIAAFESGEVAYLLRTRAAEGTNVWGQDLDNGKTVQTVPTFDGADVYYGYFDCASTEAKLTNTAVSATPVAHDYDNGFCTNELTDGTVCDAYEPAVLVTAENREELGLAESYIGYYAIGNAGQLYWFADKVDNENATYGSVNVVLTKDITVNEGTVTASSTGMRDWNPIGWFSTTSDDRAAFSGTFDGNGKRVSGLYFNNIDISGVSLVAITGETALVKNVTVTNSYFCAGYNSSAVVAINIGTVSGCFNEATLSGDSQIGGIVGRNLGLVELCGNTGAIAGGFSSVGGIVGDNQSTVRNCWNTGNIQAEYNYVGGITGANNSNGTDRIAALTENCWSTGTVVSFGRSTAGGIVGAAWVNLGGVRNCYSLMKPVGGTWNAHPITNAEAVTLDQFASGEVAYLLRTRAAEGTDVWGQNIDNDQTKQDVPALNGADVYQVVLDCAGSLGYSNTNASKAVHNYDDNGFCTNENAEGGLCDAYEPAVLVTSENYTELDLTEDYVGYYAITNAGQLYWFADKVDNENAAFGSAKVVLTDNITVNSGTVTAESTGLRTWNPIGDETNTFNGTFDGNHKTISGLYFNNENAVAVGLIASVGNAALVKDVTLTNSYLRGKDTLGGIVGMNYGTVTGCTSKATIVCRDNIAGGIVGVNFGTVEQCGNIGTVTSGNVTAGGIAGYSVGMVRNCWNSGNVTAKSQVAGIVAYLQRQTGSAGLVENCWSTGTVTGGDRARGIVGIANGESAIRNCYTTMSVAIDPAIGDEAVVENVATKTEDQFASGEVAYLLRTRAAEGTNVWGQDLDNGKTPQTVPTFDGADVYQITVDCAGTNGYSNTDADKVPHALTHVPAVAATCTEEGNIEHWSCVCGKFFAEEACTTELAAEDISTQPTGHTYGTEGTCININNGVVCGHGAGASLTTKTGGTKFFDTLQDALDAAKTTVAADEAVVKVLKDVEETDKISTVLGGVFTLDVGDAKLVGDGYGLSVDHATVTITGNTGYIDCIYGLYSDLIIDGVTVKAQQSSSTAINMQYCNLTVKSGSVINNKYGGYAILGYGEDYEIVIEGGTITATGTAGKGIALMGGTTVSVTGGTIHAVEDIITMDGLCSLSGVLAGGSFPGGLYVNEDGKELNPNKALVDGFAYWQQDVQVDVDDDAESIQGDVEVKGDCKHPSITYSASGYVLTADCDTCSAASALELIPQTDAEKIYSGTEKSAAYTGSILGLDTVPVTYTGDRVNVGSFTASVTVGGAAVEMPMEIVPYELEVKTFTLADKVYDGTNTCTVTSLSFVSTANGEQLVLGTDFTAQLTFPAADAGDYTDAVLTVELKPTALASNYILKSDTVTGISHSIDPATITVTDVEVADKVYDGTTDATVTAVTISGVVPGDDVKVEVQAAFADKNSGTDKPVNLTYTLSGADAGNYVLAEETGRTTTSITVKPLEEIVEPVKDLSVDNVTSDDKETLEDLKEELEFVLTDEGLSDEQRKEREDALQDMQDMLDRIQDAADAITTDPIMDTKDITADNITLDDREDVEQALEDLYGALEDYENNYTDAEKEGIHDDIERLEAALAALKQVEDLIKDIEELPDEVQPDTDLRDDILDAKDRYDELDDHQKDLVPEEILQKLNDLLADMKIYLIIEGDGQTWTDGDLSFTANGPFDLFMELKIDGSTVAASNYTAVSGSTVLTLKESYVETLTAGKHSIKFVYPDGEAVGSFTVEIPTNGSATTGDEAPILLLAVMMSVSLAGALMLLERKRKV